MFFCYLHFLVVGFLKFSPVFTLSFVNHISWYKGFNLYFTLVLQFAMIPVLPYNSTYLRGKVCIEILTFVNVISFYHMTGAILSEN